MISTLPYDKLDIDLKLPYTSNYGDTLKRKSKSVVRSIPEFLEHNRYKPQQQQLKANAIPVKPKQVDKNGVQYYINDIGHMEKKNLSNLLANLNSQIPSKANLDSYNRPGKKQVGSA